MGCGNNVMGILNFLTALISVPIIGIGIWLATTAHATVCMRFMLWPVIILGVAVFLVSLAGFFGNCCHVTWLLYTYTIFMFLLVIALVALTVFTFVVTNQPAGDAVSGKGYDGHHLGNYSTWLQRHVEKDSVWNKVKTCLADTNTCKKLSGDHDGHLSPIQSGCCQPPADCGYALVGANTWARSGYDTSSADSDCSKWSNDQSRLCYDCDTCKAGVVQTVRKHWWKAAIVNAVASAVMAVLFGMSVCACREERRQVNYYGRVL